MRTTPSGLLTSMLLVGSLLAGGAALADAVYDKHLSDGQAAYKAHRYFDAIRAFEAGLEAAKSDVEKTNAKDRLATAYGALGTEYFNAGETRLAEENFRKGLEFAANYYSHFGLGYLFFQRMDDDKAYEHLRSSLSHQAEFSGTHKLIGLLEYRRGKTQQAIDRLERAFALDKTDQESEALLRHWRKELQFSKTFKTKTTARFEYRIDPKIANASVQIVTRELEKARSAVERALGWAPERRVIVVLFDEESFHEATGSLHFVGGLYDGQLKMPVPKGKLSDRAKVDALIEVIRHEYAHVAIRHIAPECPVWLNEGIAQHFEFEVDRDALSRRLYRGRGKRLAFRDVPTRLWEVADVELARWTYLQGFGFVEFLVENYKEFRLRLLLVAMSEERSVARAFQRTYGRPLEELEEAWWLDVTRRGRE